MQLKKFLYASAVALGMLAFASTTLAKVPVMVMSDFGEDPDDEQSMVRFLLFSNQFDVKGLLVTADPSDGTSTVQSGKLRSVIDSYGNDLNNLRKLDSAYPSASELKAVVKDDMFLSNPFGGNNLGSDSKYQTDAVKHIISEVDKSSQPIWFVAWGGARPISQALYTVKNTRSASEFNAFVSKVRVHAIFRQDDSYDWVYNNAQNTFWIYDGSTSDRTKQTFRGMYLTGDTSLVSSSWVSSNISNHGSLSGRYPANAAGVSGIKEGDTPSFLYLLNPTLNNPEVPTQGGWGGRYQKMSGRDKFYVDLSSGARETVSQWRQAYQNAFAARLDWAKNGSGNRAPEIKVVGQTTRTVSPGSTVTLDISGSSDPDSSSFNPNWSQLTNEDSYSGNVGINTNNGLAPKIVIPQDASGKNIHILLQASDNGSPALTSYQRFILNVSDQPAEPVKIMPLGDSITQSNSSHNSYRRELWKLLNGNDYKVDFVGSLNTNYNGGPPNTDFDRDHEGHWGWEINEVLQYIDNWASTNTPDIALIHLGTNDAFAGQSTASSITELGQLIDKLRSHNSSVKIVLAQPINHNRSDRPSIKPLVDAIPQLSSKSTAQSPIYIVDMYTGFDAASMTFDSVHPNEAGEKFMAEKWFGTLKTVLNGEVPTGPKPMTGLPDIISDGLLYTNRNYSWTQMSQGAKLYTDRDYFFSTVNPVYKGLALLQTPNDDKQTDANAPLISFKAVKDIVVYIVFTNVNTTLNQTWLGGWSDGNPSIVSSLPGDEANRLVVSKSFSAGTTVVLNGNGSTQSQSSMYNVLVEEAKDTCVLLADLNQDNIVDLQDYGILSQDFLTTNARSDLNGDNFVDLQDYGVMAGQFLKTCN